MCTLELLSFLFYISLPYVVEMPLHRTLTFGAAHIFMISYMLALLQIFMNRNINSQETDQSSLLSKETSAVDINLQPDLEDENETPLEN
ncbi:hypothetical protein TVAGG3_0869690 [Trichomonas vaginalis G3]|uniref:hypothetical protein n=1 Tax=Trichomonas vaginalis (strain ATCC PRA-98 / G3) TaxID=412133 RepID=UPI0021E5F459|nr:hypothetical protein TVAGG3_0869690 [Trichomonas vaginalis G3]KAI5501282.1 hypothetical protein TVAGG3_0869690 [Trichomonas vaginalis G3]